MNGLKLYEVTVEKTIKNIYVVLAESEDIALSTWEEGELVHSVDIAENIVDFECVGDEDEELW